MSEDRIVRKVVALLNNCRGWWTENCELKRKFGVEGELEVVGMCGKWTINKICTIPLLFHSKQQHNN